MLNVNVLVIWVPEIQLVGGGFVAGDEWTDDKGEREHEREREREYAQISGREKS